jgi:hypothetical protein
VGFENQADERDQAGRIAAHAGAEHHAFTVGLSDLELLPRLQWHLDNPFGDAIILPTFVLAREARRTVTVALTGEGADETLGGYIHQKALWRLSRTPLARGPWRGLVARAVSLLPVPWLDRLFEYPASMGPEAGFGWRTCFGPGGTWSAISPRESFFPAGEGPALHPGHGRGGPALQGPGAHRGHPFAPDLDPSSV